MACEQQFGHKQLLRVTVHSGSFEINITDIRKTMMTLDQPRERGVQQHTTAHRLLVQAIYVHRSLEHTGH